MEGKPVLLEYLLPSDHEQEVSTSHVITPGTEFMYKLSGALRSYIISRINNDPGWRDIKVWSMSAFLSRINFVKTIISREEILENKCYLIDLLYNCHIIIRIT
jgi:hypothetical protein